MSPGKTEMGLLNSLQRKPGWSWQEVNDDFWETGTLPQPGGGEKCKTRVHIDALFLGRRVEWGVQ